MDKGKYDIVFWAYIDSVVDRCLPLMVRLNKEGYRTLLFYQNYDMFDNNSVAQEKLIAKFGIEVATYSDYLAKNPMVKALSWLIKRIKNTFLRNKLRGLRFRELDKDVNNENFAGSLVKKLGNRLNVFDVIAFDEKKKFPYGSFYIKKVSGDLGVESVAMCHGVTAHYNPNIVTGKIVDFETVIICNEKEKDLIRGKSVQDDAEIVPIGDPRFDSYWKAEVKAVFADEAGKIVPKDSKMNILYVSPGLEHFNLTDEKYKALSDMAAIAASLGCRLLLKPHPRHRYVDRIRKVMKENGMKDFIILNNDPIIAYADLVDYVVSPVSSTVFDIIPEMPEKVIIFDGFSRKNNLFNIFKGHLNFFETPEELRSFLEKKRDRRQSENPGGTVNKRDDMERFCDKWAANGEGLNTIIDRYFRFIDGKIGSGKAR